MLHEETEAFGPREEMVFEQGQSFGAGVLHAHLVLLLGEASAFRKEAQLSMEEGKK